MNEFILEYDKKMEMLLKSLPTLRNYIIEKTERKKSTTLEKLRDQDSIDSIDNIIKNKEIKYADAFFFCFSLATEFQLLSEQIKAGNIDISNLRNEEFWDKGQIDFNIALFFSYSFINEIYGKNLGIDFYKLMQTKDVYKKYWSMRIELRAWFKYIFLKKFSISIFPKKKRQNVFLLFLLFSIYVIIIM